MQKNSQKATRRPQIKNPLNRFVPDDNLCTFIVADKRNKGDA